MMIILLSFELLRRLQTPPNAAKSDFISARNYYVQILGTKRGITLDQSFYDDIAADARNLN